MLVRGKETEGYLKERATATLEGTMCLGRQSLARGHAPHSRRVRQNLVDWAEPRKNQGQALTNSAPTKKSCYGKAASQIFSRTDDSSSRAAVLRIEFLTSREVHGFEHLAKVASWSGNAWKRNRST